MIWVYHLNNYWSTLLKSKQSCGRDEFMNSQNVIKLTNPSIRVKPEKFLH